MLHIAGEFGNWDHSVIIVYSFSDSLYASHSDLSPNGTSNYNPRVIGWEWHCWHMCDIFGSGVLIIWSQWAQVNRLGISESVSVGYWNNRWWLALFLLRLIRAEPWALVFLSLSLSLSLSSLSNGLDDTNRLFVYGELYWHLWVNDPPALPFLMLDRRSNLPRLIWLCRSNCQTSSHLRSLIRRHRFRPILITSSISELDTYLGGAIRLTDKLSMN